jgi:hypothetical protein
VFVRSSGDDPAPSNRNTNCGLTSIASIAAAIPASKSRSFRPSSKNRISRSISRSVAGRRNACVASRRTIWAEHTRSSAGAVGRQMKIFRRLAVSDTPVTRWGPTMLSSFRWGSVVTPYATPICVSASVWLIGAMRSLTGPSNRWMKAAVTR